MSYALCIDDDVMLLAALTGLSDPVDYGLLVSVISLGQEYLLCAVCYAAPERLCIPHVCP